MSRTHQVTIMRHAQGLHQLNNNWVIVDPNLTTQGLQECADFIESSPAADDNTFYLIFSSPSKRCITTALLCTAKYLSKTPLGKIMVNEWFREVQHIYGCNQYSSMADLKAEFKDLIQFLTGNPDGWGKFDNKELLPESLEQRAILARLTIQRLVKEWSQAGKENIHVFVSTHSEFLPYLVEDWEMAQWKNAESRTYEFKDSKFEDAKAQLVETPESLKTRNSNRTEEVKEKWRAREKAQRDAYHQSTYNSTQRELGPAHKTFI
ncbi:hypothetical protein F4821DRAFT_146364 [Hypoxylon rubiginosum]|uniref:Uncharacterized protein n=1 Tax=Hypoxylon rubiginosum TaxID=110542 RepID=A0ACC0CYZ1_9PEZI|nr:hypothetical protein F4821DRAFT_146364 [Hypoxylon rubiginosum]